VSAIEVRAVTEAGGRKRWVTLPLELHRNARHYVPPLLADEILYFDPARNPAFAVSQARLLLALDGTRPVGRVCALVNERETEKLGRKVGRFGWFESTRDPRVAEALLGAARGWLREQGCVEMRGPLGFTDLDPGGLVVEGHDVTPTMASFYHPPWYQELVEAQGLEKEVDYLEFHLDVSRPVPLLERLRGRFEGDGYTVTSPPGRSALLEQAPRLWELLEETYQHLYGVVPLTRDQTEFYTKKYLSFLDPELVQLGYDPDGELVGLFIGMPSLSRALQRARGRWLPLGFWHILRAYRWPRTVDLLLAAVRRDEPSSAMTTRGLLRMLDTLRRRNVRYLDVNRQLETNTAVNRIWRRFETVGTRRLRVYRTPLG